MRYRPGQPRLGALTLGRLVNQNYSSRGHQPKYVSRCVDTSPFRGNIQFLILSLLDY